MKDAFLLVLQHPIVCTILLVVLALVVGSCLSMLSYRLPLVLFNDWREQCQTLLKDDEKTTPLTQPYNLFIPRSHCTQCKQALSFWQNIPLLGYLLQKGKCRQCSAKIPLRYPLIELITLVLSLFIVYTFGLGLVGWAYLVLTWGLICITFIDIEHQIVPDEITFVLLWTGLLLSSHPPFISSQHAIIGIVSGYLTLWLIGHGYRLVRKKEGIGYGDYKLMALFGAWLGWQLLPIVLFAAACLGLIFGGIGVMTKRITVEKPIAFAPYLAISGWIVIIFAPQIKHVLMDSIVWYLS